MRYLPEAHARAKASTTKEPDALCSEPAYVVKYA